MPSDDGINRSEQQHQFKIGIHTAGAKHGGPPQDPAGHLIGHTIYVGRHGEMPFSNYGRSRVTGHHNGGHPEIQSAMLCANLEGGCLGDPSTARERVIPGSDLAKLLEEIRVGVYNASWQAYYAWKRGEPPVGHLAIVCNQGRHRSVAVAKWVEWILRDLEIPVGVRHHHNREMGPVETPARLRMRKRIVLL